MNQAERIETFMAERPRLLRLAYRYLGKVADAEDVVQDAWLRFANAEDIQSPAAFLSTVVTRLCLDRLKSAAYNRELYAGPWLPEPIIVDQGATQNEAALDISFAIMRSFETLGPEERAAFFLHDLFDVSYEEISQLLDRTPANCRKLAQRARERIKERQARFVPETEQVQNFVFAFQTAIESNDVTKLSSLLANDVEFISDGGGKVAAVPVVVTGSERVAKLLFELGRNALANQRAEVRPATINDGPGLLVFLNGILDVTIAFDVDSLGAITTFYLVRNPDKLKHLAN